MSIERPSQSPRARQSETVKEVDPIEIVPSEIQTEPELELEPEIESPESEPTVEEVGEERVEETAEETKDAEETPEAVAPPVELTPMQKELQNILKLPRAERKTAMASFKKKLVEQQETQAFYRTRIEKALEKNPDMPKEAVMKLLEMEGKPFPEKSKEKAEQMLDSYYTQRGKALEARANFPDDHELVKHLTGYDIPPKTRINLKIGPMSIDIFADRETINEIEKSKGYFRSPVDGFAANGPNGEYYSFINVSRKDKKKIVIHERQHHTNKMLRDFFEKTDWNGSSWELENAYNTAEEPEEKKELLTTYFEAKRGAAYERAKDEIFAVHSESGKLWRIKHLLKPGTEGSNYDYLKDLRERHPDDPLWKEVSDKELVKEYYRVIDNSIETLESMTDYYSPEELTAILTPIPLEDWSKAAARIYQEKLSDPNIKPGDVKNIKNAGQKGTGPKAVIIPLGAKESSGAGSPASSSGESEPGPLASLIGFALGVAGGIVGAVGNGVMIKGGKGGGNDGSH